MTHKQVNTLFPIDKNVLVHVPRTKKKRIQAIRGKRKEYEEASGQRAHAWWWYPSRVQRAGSGHVRMCTLVRQHAELIERDATPPSTHTTARDGAEAKPRTAKKIKRDATKAEHEPQGTWEPGTI